jgi:hypothetical protein
MPNKKPQHTLRLFALLADQRRINDPPDSPSGLVKPKQRSADH